MIDSFAAQLRAVGLDTPPAMAGPVLDIAFDVGGRTRRYFSTITTLGTPADVSLQEIRLELFHPNDR